VDAARWQLLKRLLSEASALSPGERASFLDEHCAGDPELRRELVELLDSAGARTSDLMPPHDTAAPTVIDGQAPAGSGFVPDQVGPYRVGRELGRGGMGVVHAAVDERDGKDVALKLLHRGLLSSERAVARFLREARAGVKVRHENVVRTLEAGTEEAGGDGLRWLALELVEGQSLRELLADYGPLPEALVREIARQCAAGLTAIHAAGVVHRDLKPENVLVTSDQRVRLTDLGIAKVIEATASLTRDGQFIGTLRYAAPEQFEGGEVGPSSDLYSLGVLLYELATGQNPFDQEAPAAVLRAHAELDPAPADQLRPELSPFLAELLATLLRKKPADRFASATVVLRVLEEAEGAAWWRDRESELRASHASLPLVPVSRPTALHGRSDELALLRSAWERTQGGGGGVVLIEGEAGLGKSRLIDEFVRSLAGRDAHVLYGSSPPSAGLRGLSQALIGKFGAVGLRAELRRRLGDESQWGDALADAVLRDEAPSSNFSAGTETVAIAAGALLESLAAERPTVWVLEDLHFAPAEGWSLAASLARAAEGRPALVVLSARPGVEPSRLSRVSRAPGFERLALGRLDAEALQDLVHEAVAEEPLSDALSERIGRRSEGVPLFALELLRERRDAGGDAGAAEKLPLPAAVRDLVAARLESLSREQHELLDAAAVEGHEFDPALVAEVLERKPIRVLQDLAELERSQGLVRPSGSGFRFDHHLLLEVVYASLAPALRAEYHALLAEAIEKRSVESTATGRLAHRLAHHHVRGSRPTAAKPHLEAAFGHLAARHLNEGLLDLIERSLDPRLGHDETERIELLLRRAGVAEKLGRRETQRSSVDEAFALAENLGDPSLRLKARCALASLLWTVAEESEAERLMIEAREMALELGDRRMELRTMGVRGIAVLRQGRHAEAEDIQRWCLERAAELSEPIAEEQAFMNLGQACFHQSRYLEAYENFRSGVDLARSNGDPRGEGIGSGGLGIACWHLGRLEEAAEHHDRQRRISRRVGDRRSEGIATGNLGLVSLERGRAGEAIGLFRREEAIYRRVEDRRGVPLSQTNQAYALFAVGALDEAEAMLEDALPATEKLSFHRLTGHVHLRFGLIAEARGQAEKAERDVLRGLELLESTGDIDSQAEAHVMLGRIDLAADRWEQAAKRFDKAAELVREVAGPRNHVLARCWRAGLPGGDAAGAREALEKDAATVGHLGRLEAWWALHLAEGDADSLREAARHLDELVAGARPEHRRGAVERLPIHAAIDAARSSG
jgi:serine/threonine protein kinase/tetratricopeptide (TPR) repeat protein